MQKMMHVDPRRPFPRRFVPQTADMGEWGQIEPLYRELLERPIASSAELEQWLIDSSELSSAIGEERARRYIAMTQQTDDKAREAAYQHFVEHIDPQIKPLGQELSIKYLQSPHRAHLDMDRYGVMDRIVDNDVKLFRQDNVPLETQEALLSKEYQKVMAAMPVHRTAPARSRADMATLRIQTIRKPNSPSRKTEPMKPHSSAHTE